MAQKIKGRDLSKIGYRAGRATGMALQTINRAPYKQRSKERKIEILRDLLNDPEAYLKDEHLGAVAREFCLNAEGKTVKSVHHISKKAKEFPIYGEANIAKNAVDQMYTAMRLPITEQGALMPDAHAGYGLPIGGVLATNNSVIPYGVGVDIGCRMCLSVYGMPVSYLDGHKDRLKNDLLEYTRFGAGSGFKKPMDDGIFEREEFKSIPFVKKLRTLARQQIGSSGGGNHFVEYGLVKITDPKNEMGLAVGEYIGILSHSGSRGMGAKIASYYTKLAMERCDLPKEARHLAWLDLSTEAGAEYWLAMNLAGDYASACHHQIHKRLAKALGERPLAIVENHHNFAWKEQLEDGREVVVHRKGATPAGKGVLGIIPGSMTAPGFIVRGKGNALSINSAAHGAGRRMSRRQAKESISGHMVREVLREHGVSLIGGGIDEAPMAYKDINEVMSYQSDLVDVLGTFHPKIVRMSNDTVRR